MHLIYADESGDDGLAGGGTPHFLPIAWRIVGAALAGILILGAVAYFLPNMKDRMKFFTDAALSWLILVIVAVQAFIYHKQWEAMTTSLAIESAKTDQRLRVAEVRAENFEAGKRPIFIVTIANDGLIDATDVRIHMGVEIDTDKELDWIHDPVVTIPASGKEHFFILSSSGLEQQHIDGFNNAVPLKVVGYFDYWPVGRKNFCYKYLPWDGQRPERIPQFLRCDFEPRLNTTLHLSGGVMAMGDVGVVGVVVKKDDLRKIGEAHQPQDNEKNTDRVDP